MSGLFSGSPFERPVTCAICEQSSAECGCPRTSGGHVYRPRDQAPRVQRERRSGGKIITTIGALDGDGATIDNLLREFRKSLACGGAVVNGNIELQGDHRDRVVEVLRGMGYAAKASGG